MFVWAEMFHMRTGHDLDHLPGGSSPAVVVICCARIWIVHVQPRKRVLFCADYADPTPQRELDHAYQEYTYPESRSQLGIDHTDYLSEMRYVSICRAFSTEYYPATHSIRSVHQR